MLIAIPVFGIALAALCVWLSIRIINRRERWAKWALAVTVVTALFGYPVSIGPACWLTARPVAPPVRVVIAAGGAGGGGGATSRPGDPPNQAMSVYYPLLDFLRRNSYTRMKPYSNSIEQAMYWWMRVGMPRGTVAMIPDPTGGHIGVGAKDPPPATWQPSPNWWQFDQPIWILFAVCAIGIGLSIWYAPADAAICALLGRVPANPPPWWAWWCRVSGVAVCAFGLALALYFYLLGW